MIYVLYISVTITYRVFFLQPTVLEQFSQGVFYTKYIVTAIRQRFIEYNVHNKAETERIFQILYGPNALQLPSRHYRQPIAQKLAFVHAVGPLRKGAALSVSRKIQSANDYANYLCEVNTIFLFDF